VKRVGLWLLVLVLALPATQGQDAPKDEKKPASARERYAALEKEYSAEQQKIVAEYQKTKGEEQQKVLQRYYGLGKEFAEKFYKLAEDNPKDPAAADALFWVIQNASGSPPYKKAVDRVTALVAEMPLRDLYGRLNRLRGGSPELFDAVVKRAEKDVDDPQAPNLLAWVATGGAHTPAGQKAVERLVEKYPDNDAIERVCTTLGRMGSPDSVDTLKKVLEKATKPRVKAAAALAMARSLASQTDRLGNKPAEADKVAAEAEKYFTQAIDLYGKGGATGEAERELNALRTLRIGKEAPEIKGEDLDGKEFKLSDYRGKVVLLDFWGNW